MCVPVPLLEENEALNMFDHEKLDVYVAAIKLVVLADGVVETLP